jgi:hypothetical protein
MGIHPRVGARHFIPNADDVHYRDAGVAEVFEDYLRLVGPRGTAVFRRSIAGLPEAVDGGIVGASSAPQKHKRKPHRPTRHAAYAIGDVRRLHAKYERTSAHGVLFSA